MAIAKKEQLTELISTLDTSEKRFFTRYTNQSGAGEDDKFYRLFQHLSKGGSLEDPKLDALLGITGPTQLVNLQRHLYGRILDALRLQHRRRDAGIQVREQIDYANLLYDRGLYLHALKLLARAKEQAFTYHLDLHHLLIIDFEKLIESRHITRSSPGRMAELTTESRKRQAVMDSTVRQSNLQLVLQRYFIQHGHVGNAAAARQFYQLFHHYFSDPVPASATYQERVLAHQCRFWFHYNQLQLERAGYHAFLWTEQIRGRNELRERDVNFYIKGMDRRLLIAFFRDDLAGHAAASAELATFLSGIQSTQQQRNSQFMADILLLRVEMDRHLLTKPCSCAPAQIEQLGERAASVNGVDRHKQLVLYYKLSVICVLSGHLNRALTYLDPVLNERKPLRHDLIVYARLLQLVCHYRLGHLEFVTYGINNLARYLGRIGYASEYPTLVLQLLRGLLRGEGQAAHEIFAQRLRPLRDTIFHLREFRYFGVDALLPA
ncbi:hypothetical protein CLV84_0494 [Neolewinella xylanilytica]|uniref:Uncharacterized protein n=1 Tax=Neolewinella xylanilytica TaxID=1514080 RepID=A0A2S6I7S2_9BACT|nr:hypothetical protein [Neolewinella xylanilytica]PPK87551.1 hypothetical protein CLV84_0494 [Neolewinella xylanilytica]